MDKITPLTQLRKERVNGFSEIDCKSIPLLKLRVTDLPGYFLDKEDLSALFSRYRIIVKVIVKTKNIAYVLFNDLMSALYAQKSLDNYELKDIGVKLFVKWYDPKDDWLEIGDKAELMKIQHQFKRNLLRQKSLIYWMLHLSYSKT